MSGPDLFAAVRPGDRVVVALDIDGTLVDTGDRTSDRVRAAVRGLADLGVMIVLATGRQLHGTTPVVAHLGLGETWVVASNGAIVARYLGTRRTMLATTTFDPTTLAAELLRLDPDVTLGCEEVGVGYLVDKPFGEVIPADHTQRLVTDFPQNVTMFSAESAALTGAQLAQAAAACGLSAQGWDEYGRGLVDVAGPATSKGAGVAALVVAAASAAHLTVAAGDFHNDLEMLQWADIAIVMGQAPDAVKAVADHVADPIADDGLAPVLEKLLAAMFPTAHKPT